MAGKQRLIYVGACPMRNVFDQFSGYENRLTHSLATVLHEDRGLLRSFLSSFAPSAEPPIEDLSIIEQALPGRLEQDEQSAERLGLPDALIFNQAGWVLIIESKVMAPLTMTQLRQHEATLRKCGYDDIQGVAIVRDGSSISLPGWKLITWRSIYAWALRCQQVSEWAQRLVSFFKIAESKMVNDGHLTEGTITEFSGIYFEAFTYLEGKRILKLLMQKLRNNTAFMDEMGLDPASGGRGKISNTPVLWDLLEFIRKDENGGKFTEFPHCNITIGAEKSGQAIIFPNNMKGALRKSLCGDSLQDFTDRLSGVATSIETALERVPGACPMITLLQRHWKHISQPAKIDGELRFDLRVVANMTALEGSNRIKHQKEWAKAAYELLRNKGSTNIEFQVGIQYPYDRCPEIKRSDADQVFVDGFLALKPFVYSVLEEYLGKRDELTAERA